MSPSFLQGLPKTPLCLEVDPWLPHTHAKPSLITVLCVSCPWLYLFVSTYHRLALPPHSEISDSRTLTSPHLADSTNGCSVQACWIDSVTRLWPEARGTGTTWVVGLWWQVPSDGKGHLIQWEGGSGKCCFGLRVADTQQPVTPDPSLGPWSPNLQSQPFPLQPASVLCPLHWENKPPVSVV